MCYTGDKTPQLLNIATSPQGGAMTLEDEVTQARRDSPRSWPLDWIKQVLGWSDGSQPSQEIGAPGQEPDVATQVETLEYFAEITSIARLDQLLEVVSQKTSKLVNAAGCSVYLIPELVPGFDGTLVDSKDKTIKASKIKRDYAVLAASSRPGTEKLIGRAFYPSGYGLSGWVFKRGAPLRLADMSDLEELDAIDPDLRWTDRYGGSRHYYRPEDKKPILVVPLVTDSRTIGILKFPAALNQQPFSDRSEQIATVVAQTIASIIRRTWMVEDQGRTIHRLVEIGAKAEAKEAYETVTRHLAEMLGCTRCQLYLRDEDGSSVSLVAEKGKVIEPGKRITYQRGQSLVGWVFKTGRPLLLADMRHYAEGRQLDDELLERISDGERINDDDRFLKWEGIHYPQTSDSRLPFIAVPVKAGDKSTQGVLCAQCEEKNGGRQVTTLGATELELARSFASSISLALENEQAQLLGDLLIRLGYDWELDKLHNLVIERVPNLVSGTGCCIYSLVPGSEGNHLRLVSASREGLVTEAGEPADIVYQLGEGKTGFCGLAKATVVVNHYGVGKVARRALESEKERILSKYKRDWIADLCDASGQQVGLLQIRNGLEIPPQSLARAKKLAKSLVIDAVGGLPTPKSDEYRRLGSRPSWSFVAVPIKYESNDLYGVITIGRPVESNPFSAKDVTLLESIAGRLAAITHNHQILEERKRQFMTLSHEITIPLTGMLADSENLMNELSAHPELSELSRHNLEQVMRLDLLSQTILVVLSDKSQKREFSVHSVYRPLIEARSMFESEAASKGCDILKPESSDGFPEIEMSLFDLTTAFKNIIHNGIKYSFRPPKWQEANRYVRITGEWADAQREWYRVKIQNYGVGISQYELDKGLIFEPNYRGEKATDHGRVGAGFGLAHARRIITDMHHGSIDVTSRPLGGDAHLTTFTITLPIRQPSPAHPAQNGDLSESH
jgi:signal transduction histidine kinase